MDTETDERVAQRSRLAWHWPVFFFVIGAGWIVLFFLSRSSVTHVASSWSSTVAMWLAMSIVMMSTTAVPVLQSLADVVRKTSFAVWWVFLVAYLVMWALYSVVAASLQMLLGGFGWMDGHSTQSWLSGLILLAAGAYQFSSLKQRCQSECVSPMTFFLRYWREGLWGGFKMGLRHGATCIGCCWALMLLAFVGGMVNAAFMALCALVMALEKFPTIGTKITRPLGIALVAAGISVLAFDFISAAPIEVHQHL
jgi:predicted metal-binding membrane protein